MDASDVFDLKVAIAKLRAESRMFHGVVELLLNLVLPESRAHFNVFVIYCAVAVGVVGQLLWFQVAVVVP